MFVNIYMTILTVLTIPVLILVWYCGYYDVVGGQVVMLWVSCTGRSYVLPLFIPYQRVGWDMCRRVVFFMMCYLWFTVGYLRLYGAEVLSLLWIMNWKGFGWKSLWPNLGHYTGIFPMGLRRQRRQTWIRLMGALTKFRVRHIKVKVRNVIASVVLPGLIYLEIDFDKMFQPFEDY
jgi:hypothetical protein